MEWVADLSPQTLSWVSFCSSIVLEFSAGNDSLRLSLRPGKLHFFLKSFSEEFRVGSRYKFSETDLNDV